MADENSVKAYSVCMSINFKKCKWKYEIFLLKSEILNNFKFRIYLCGLKFDIHDKFDSK